MLPRALQRILQLGFKSWLPRTSSCTSTNRAPTRARSLDALQTQPGSTVYVPVLGKLDLNFRACSQSINHHSPRYTSPTNMIFAHCMSLMAYWQAWHPCNASTGRMHFMATCMQNKKVTLYKCQEVACMTSSD